MTNYILDTTCILICGLYCIYKNYIIDKEKQDFKNGITNYKYINVQYKKNNKIIKSKLLVDGHWNSVRHMNYTYEILLSIFWIAPGYNFKSLSILYLIYIIILLVHRIYRDEHKCSKKYDLYWNMIAELKYDSEGTLTNQSVSEYDSIGNHIAWSMYDSKCNLASFNEGDLFLKDYSKWVRKYDTNGNQIEALFYDDEENLSQRYVYQYGDDQNYEYMVYACE